MIRACPPWPGCAGAATCVDFRAQVNPASLTVVEGARIEPALATARPGDRFQFERKSYYVADLFDSREGAPVFNLTVPLRDT